MCCLVGTITIIYNSANHQKMFKIFTTKIVYTIFIFLPFEKSFNDVCILFLGLSDRWNKQEGSRNPNKGDTMEFTLFNSN